MRFSSLLTRIGAVQDGSPRNLAGDPEITGAEALDRAGPGQLAFLEPGNALAAALSASRAAALLLPLDEEIQQLASDRGLAWVALANPRLGFAEALAALHPPTPKPPGIHTSAVVDPSAAVAAAVHVGAHAVIGADCVVAGGCVLHPGVVLYENVQLGEGCEIHAQAVLHPGSRLGAGCVVQSQAVIGAEGFGFVPTATGWVKMPQTGQVVLEDGVEVGCGSTIDRPAVGETRIGAGTKIDNLVHVGHGVVTGKGCALAAQVGIAGGAVLGNGVILAGQVGVANRAVIGDRAIASSKSGIHGEIAAGEVVSGYPAIPNRLWLRCSAVFNKLPEMARTLRQLQK
ncbi:MULTISPECIES: UDP-3-O-(3-hydroxymyristoyl)glucosamine N-acyltransferase [unclassified Cyanobium]|uniref:UDP-3-O-(3-hydroxymyristoyl)glucosamine N-acyltransferase n=1 Tax=unclassified Cyanobium TaxID=2627006 RepID=UPI0020CBF003|nr:MULTISPECIES: UDP-3-O-(3-hydroxymyristoyl)glucosamine N-acyltransferase [unclassified Cyanobium]MCP9833328.1 UDP-3-O-(3-hydroxymyristoyl)glucosamine N-acyltransferase [Cyanobium sp. La Preciosa 7G6]MCP9935809.1 UDP-3-O-(3-hydroxymyristoyl)glucosamine N-acyltransferase [Cyanobium sp. Aljojuca 7A6]